MAEALERMMSAPILAALRQTPVVIVEGGRAVGKSTLCDKIIASRGWLPRIDLSDQEALATLRLDPLQFLEEHRSPLVIDEAQLEPQLLVWIKRIVDKRRRPGQFLLTGSARLGRSQLGGSDPLVGRSVRLSMLSMSQAELEGRKSDFIERAFGESWSTSFDVTRSERDAVSRSSLPSHLRGGLPGMTGVLRKGTLQQWEREIAAYVEGVLPLGALGTRADLGRLLRTFRYFAANSSQLVNLARTASDLGVQANTVRNHLEMLEGCFLLMRVEAERGTEARVLTAHPRVFAADVGLATWAARAWTGSVSASLRGALLETVVAHDVIAQANASVDRVLVRHWRDQRNQHEVDLLLVHPDGRSVPIEVKASSTVGPDDARGLRIYMQDAGDSCPRGVLVYEGERVVRLSARGSPEIVAVPRALL
jgi:uncharacterized protein